MEIENSIDGFEEQYQAIEDGEKENQTVENKKNQKSDDGEKVQEVGPDGLPINEVHEEEEDEGKELRVKRCATIMNILNSLLGAGVLSVPQSFTYCGIIPSLIILTIVAVLSHVGTVMTMNLAKRKEAITLNDLAFKILGKPGSILISICSMLFCISCMLGYLIICSNTIISWFDAGGIVIDDQLWKRAILLLVYGLCFPIAFTFPRDIGFLAPASYMTFVCILIFVVAMVIKAGLVFPYSEEEKPNIILAKGDMGLFSAISIYGLAFALPVIIMPLVKPYNPDLHKRNVVSLASTTICFICVIVPGIIGYLMFGDNTESIILDNFPSKDPLIIVVRVAFFIVVSFSYPCIAQSLLVSWSSIIWRDSNQGGLSFWKRAVVLLATNIIPLLIAIFLPNAKPALSIGGAFGGCMVDFFFPAIMWIRISKKPFYHWNNILCILFAIFGLVSTAISTYQAVVDAIAAFKS